MGWMLIALVVGIFLDVRNSRSRHYSPFLWAALPAVTAIVLFVMMILDKSEYQMIEHQKEIVAIADNTHLSGEFSGGMFVFSGSIDSQPVYSYYARRGDGFVQEHVPSNLSIIYEDTKDAGYIKWTTCDANMPFDWWEWKYNGCEGKTVSYESDLVGHYEIHVPPGSVVQSFNLDLNG